MAGLIGRCESAFGLSPAIDLSAPSGCPAIQGTDDAAKAIESDLHLFESKIGTTGFPVDPVGTGLNAVPAEVQPFNCRTAVLPLFREMWRSPPCNPNSRIGA